MTLQTGIYFKMLTLETWNKLSEAETYQIYNELCQKEDQTLSLLLEKMEQTSKLLVNVTNYPENGKNLEEKKKKKIRNNLVNSNQSK